MTNLLLPLVLLLLGVGGGVGAGLALAPAGAPPTGAALASGTPEPCGPPTDGDRAAGGEQAGGAAGGQGGEGEGGPAYVKLPNQFIVPLVEGGDVAALVLLSLSLEVPAGAEDQVAPIEPKLRSAILQVLFDHANTGGFDGMFTAGAAMRSLRADLLDAARDASGGLVGDVLIVEMVREDR